METRVWVKEWEESSLNNESYHGYIVKNKHFLFSSVEDNPGLVRIETENGASVIAKASEIITAVRKITLE